MPGMLQGSLAPQLSQASCAASAHSITNTINEMTSLLVRYFAVFAVASWSVSGHGVITKVTVNGNTACSVNAKDPTCNSTNNLKLREVIPRYSSNGFTDFPGKEMPFKCDWCGLEKVCDACHSMLDYH
jgi:hypothetical protein